MFRLLYQIVLHLSFLAVLPRMLWVMFRTGKYRHNFWRRFGYEWPEFEKTGPVIWVHAVSMGETLAIVPLVEQLRQQIPGVQVITSHVTETGYRASCEKLPWAAAHVYLPWDFYWLQKKLVRKIAPDLLILAETDYWYEFQRQVLRGGGKIVVVNAKMSPKTLGRWGWLPGGATHVMSQVDLFCLQGEVYRERFRQLGVPTRKLVVTGNVKLDRELSTLRGSEVDHWRERLGVSVADPVFVAGSTHDPEEKVLLEQMRKIWEVEPNFKLVLVPRHPERFDEVAKFLAKEGVSFVRDSHDPDLASCKKAQVVLVDRMGVLLQVYQLASIAFVGGSLTEKVGGHNILEPCGYGVPVLHGPHMHSQPVLLDLMSCADCGLEVQGDQIAEVVLRLWQDELVRQRMGASGKELMAAQRGATMRSFERVKQLIPSFLEAKKDLGVVEKSSAEL